ncbi:MAG: hypothetical protein GY862_08715 [Gammaproteobacteria bacterium]|nr:hypothetical protein [Gammaproteobacteria bacterium]
MYFQLVALKLAHMRQPARLILKDRRGAPLAHSDVQLKPGTNRFSFTWQSSRTGIFEYTLHVEAEGDTVPENNAARMAIDLIGPPKVLVINHAGRPGALSRALADTGLQVETRAGFLRGP